MPSAHLSAFRSRAYRHYFPSAIFSTLGSWILRFLLGWSAWDLTHSATWVGATAGLMLAPALVLSPLFGIVSDRINPRNGQLLTVSAHAGLACVAGAAVYSGVFTLPVLLTIALALGVATSAHTPIRLALVPLLVPRESLPSAIGYSAIVFNTSRILGPALGAWLLHTASPAVAYVSGAALMLGALPFLVFIPDRIGERSTRARTGFFRELADGLRYTRAHSAMRLVLAFTLVNALLGRTVIELLPAVSGLLLDGNSATLAKLTACAGIGSIVGGLVVSRQGGSEPRLFRLMILSLALGALLVAVLGWFADVRAVSIVIGGISLITTIAGTSNQALAQLLVDEHFRGRVLSLWTMIAMGAPAAGAVVMGGLGDLFPLALVLTGFAMLALLAIGWLSRRAGQHSIP
ncbi:MFS transporter [Seongchinamella unica]|uniref:MFS transporter n=1 Tax=Seongchinamella unica TaxID=2547392 RepID=A0A4R5LR93_9GAMM|nr:MFS transporter [Seongchinamella unica]TDG13361.1 MFS transporter [Seongchinamella unica]